MIPEPERHAAAAPSAHALRRLPPARHARRAVIHRAAEPAARLLPPGHATPLRHAIRHLMIPYRSRAPPAGRVYHAAIAARVVAPRR